ncbi:hypothetical protein Lalb_Chr09g0325101 [Lupinus albus]|uniref:Uncharacterized protein n=1 Tax=Lupinus albus TaxID=3870 RepID=A0A6A4Q0C9_LUPAL|nr:hypothetical protein Lalb_Chr09g0325101 [Lupinus albus]
MFNAVIFFFFPIYLYPRLHGHTRSRPPSLCVDTLYIISVSCTKTTNNYIQSHGPKLVFILKHSKRIGWESLKLYLAQVAIMIGEQEPDSKK